MAFSSRTMTPADWATLKHFRAEELRAPNLMGYEFMFWLDGVRAAAGVPMHITSDHRTQQHNAEVGGASDSAHTDVPCNAVDIGVRPTSSDPNWNRARFRIVAAALAAGCVRIGIYPNGSLHLDRTELARPAEVIWIKVR